MRYPPPKLACLVVLPLLRSCLGSYVNVAILHVCSFLKHREQVTMWCPSQLICLHHTTPAAVTQGSHQKGSRKSVRGDSGAQEVCKGNPSSRNVRVTFGFDSNSCSGCEVTVHCGLNFHFHDDPCSSI